MPIPLSPITTHLRETWSNNFGFRLGAGLSLILILVMGVGATALVLQQNHALRHAAEERARAVARTFAAVGSAAVLDNLYRLQESLQLYLQDDSLMEIDIVDPDSLVVAAKQPARIGTVLDDPEWLEARQTKREVIIQTHLHDGQPALVIIEPLFDRDELTAWVRMAISLAEVEQEQSRMIWQLLAVTIAIMAIGLYAIRLVLRQTSTALQSVVSTLHAANGPIQGSGSSQATLPSRNEGDYEQLVTAATHAASVLSAQSLMLQDLAQTLERKVAERTAELEAARLHAVRSLEDLRDNEARLRCLVETAADAIMVVDGQGIIESVNPATCMLFGYSMVELRGLKAQTVLLRTSNWPRSGDGPAHAAIGPTAEAVGRHKNGTSFPAELSVSEMTVAGAIHFTLIVRDVTERRHMKEMKQRSDQRLHQLGEERAQLYHDLHSSLLQSLSAVSMGLEAAKLLLEQSPDRAPKQLDRTLSHLHRVIQETRDYITRLEPRTAAHDRFLQSMQMLVQPKEDWPCPPFLIDIDPLTDSRLSIDQEIHLLSIAREAISNIMHHAQAQAGMIRLGSWEDMIQLEIKDNGRGFSPAEIGSSSPGLTNMSTHAKKLHGRLTIASAPGEGTTILVAIPLPQETQRADGLIHAD